MEEQINLDSKQIDQFYRYKMDPVKVKYEGGGKFIRTEILNLNSIAKDIDLTTNNIDAGKLFLFLSKKLSCSKSDTNGKYVLCGKFTNTDIQNKIYMFIDKFLLCRFCRNPETFLNTDGLATCQSCGKNYKIVDDDFKFICNKK